MKLSKIDRIILLVLGLITAVLFLIFLPTSLKVLGALMIFTYLFFILLHAALGAPLILMFFFVSDYVDYIIKQEKSKLIHGFLVTIGVAPIAAFCYVIFPAIGTMLLLEESSLSEGIKLFFTYTTK